MDQAVGPPTRHSFSWVDQSDRRWLLALAAAVALVLLLNPLGYIGGGWDDWQYLTAARCWAEHGACLPRTHWEGRWPVFAPIAAFFDLFGESRASLSIWPFISSVAALGLLVLAGNRAFGRPIGWIGALLLLVTPAFSIQLLAPSVEALELALILGGVCCILWWNERRGAGWAFAAGLCFGLALQVRETSVIATLLAGLWVATKRPRPLDIGVAVVAFLMPLAAEFLIYGIATGDPLFRRHLSLSHTQIPSSELLGPIDHKGSPFFNPAYIANWRHEPGVRVHWLIDGFVNLFINGKAGLSLGLVPLLLIVGRSSIPQPDRRRALALFGLAIFYAAVLIYALAIDPKARVMFVPLTASSLAFALLVKGMWRGGNRLLSTVVIAAHALVGLTILFIHQRTDILEAPARAWIEQYNGKIEIDVNTKRHLALVPGAEQLPELESDKEYLIYNSALRCDHWIVKGLLPDGSVQILREVSISRLGLLPRRFGGSLCLVRYLRPVDADRVRAAIERSRVDGKYIMDPRIYLGRSVRR